MAQIVARVPDETVAALDRLAEASELRRSDVIRAAIRQYLAGPRITVSGGTTGSIQQMPDPYVIAATSPGMGNSYAQVETGPALPADWVPDPPHKAEPDEKPPPRKQPPQIPGVVRASSLPRPSTTERPGFRGPIPKGGKK